MVEEEALTISPEFRANRIMQDAAALRLADPSLFLRVAQEIARKAETVSAPKVGEDHPLAGLLNTPFDDPYFDTLMSNVAAYRRRQEESEDSKD